MSIDNPHDHSGQEPSADARFRSEPVHWTPVPGEPQFDPVGEYFRTLLGLTPSTPVTVLIVAANLAIFGVMALVSGGLIAPQTDTLLSWGALYGPYVSEGQYWRLLTSVFLHFGAIHVGVNMWVLWDAGRFVERLVGNAGYLVLYLFSGLCGSLASAYFSPYSVCAGASGAVFGVFGGLMAFVVKQRHLMPPVLFQRLRKSMFSFLVLNLIIGVSVPFIGLAAHIGGLIGGFLAGFWLVHPVTPDGARGRFLHNAVLLLVAPPLLIVATLPLYGRFFDLDGWLKNFSATERETMEQVRTAGQQFDAGELTSEQFSNVVQNQVIPRWYEALDRLPNKQFFPRRQAEFVAAIRPYADKRIESWRLVAEGIRESNVEKVNQGKAAAEEADRLVKALNDLNK